MKFYRLGMLAIALSAIAPAVSPAQSPPRNITVHLQDSVFLNRIGPEGDTASPDSFWATYSFENSYADSGNVFFSFTEAKRNGQRIELENWKPFQFIKDSTAEALSGISRTRPFTVTGGDVISYYREFAWQKPTDGYLQMPDNFYSDDTLEYVIRLRKESNNMELAVLDSVGVLAQVPTGSPTFYGTGLPMAITEYEIPSAITTSTSVYLSIDVRAKGNGNYYTCRSDQVTRTLSEAITNSLWSEYFLELVGVSPKRVSGRLEELRGKMSEGTSLKVVPNPSTSGDIRILTSSPSSGDRRTILVYSIDGKIVYSYSTVSTDNALEVALNIADPGSYYVVSMIGSEIVGVDLLNVVQ